MSDHDDLAAQIERLHEEAQDLADLASNLPPTSHAEAQRLRKQADAKIRQAARLRAQMEDH